ncbi:MAG: site-2 protease family protein [Anaerolineae bacterium]|nr:site-2 protease family protein [Anaerolineae bacterium]
MNKSWRMARIAGVDIDVHWSFSFIIVWILLRGFFDMRSLYETLLFSGGILLVFGCVVLHELGHALMALNLNLQVKNIILLPIGGLTQIQSTPDRPLSEFLIALTGPLVNLAFALVLMPTALLLGGQNLVYELLSNPLLAVNSHIHAFFQENTVVGLLILLVAVNLILFLFNLIPAWPLDGGRILRATLTPFCSYRQATKIVLLVGCFIAFAFLMMGLLFHNVGLLLIAIFIFLSMRPASVPS